MMVSVRGTLVHRCPFKDETDVGTFTMEWAHESGEVELHRLRGMVDDMAAAVMTHEEATEFLAARFPFACVTTSFLTAGLTMECHAVPRDPAH